MPQQFLGTKLLKNTRSMLIKGKSHTLMQLREGNIKLSKVFGSKVWCHSEKAIAANCAAVREWDSNGTVFGYNPNLEGHQAGEYGHNDFYPVIIAGCQNNAAMDGKQVLKAMVLLDEIRGRLCEVFPLKKY